MVKIGLISSTKRLAEGLEEHLDADPEDECRDDRRDEDRGSGRRQDVELVDGRVRRRLADDRHVLRITRLSRPGICQEGERADNGPFLAESNRSLKPGKVQIVTMTVRTMNGDHALTICPRLWVSRGPTVTLRVGADALEGERAGRMPNLEKQRKTDQAEQRRGDVGQLVSPEVGREELANRERQAGHQDRRPGLPHPARAIHDVDEPQRHEHREQRQLSAGHLADQERVGVGHLAGDGDRNAERAEGDGRGIGDQAETRRVQRIEAQADQQCRGDRDGRSEAGRALEERAEAEPDQHHLQSLVGGNRQHRGANDLELPRLDRELVEKHRRDDDPRDRP